MAKGGTAVAGPHNSSFVFARWQHSTDGLAAIWLGVVHPKSTFPWGSGTAIKRSVSFNPTNVPARWHLNPSNALGMGHHECDRRQTDGPCYGEMWTNRRFCLQERIRLKYWELRIKHARSEGGFSGVRWFDRTRLSVSRSQKTLQKKITEDAIFKL